MKDGRTLALLTELAQKRRDESARRAAQGHREVAAAQAKLDALDGFRREYLGRSPMRSAQAVDPGILRTFTHFMGRLDSAVEEQTRQRDGSAQRAARLDEELMRHERSLGALRKLGERREAALRRASDKREQKLNDEIAARLSARRGDALQ